MVDLMLTCEPLPTDEVRSATGATLRLRLFEVLLRQPLSRESLKLMLLQWLTSLLERHRKHCAACDLEGLGVRLGLILHHALDAHLDALSHQSRHIGQVIGTTAINDLVSLGDIDPAHIATAQRRFSDKASVYFQSRTPQGKSDTAAASAGFVAEVLAELLFVPGLPYRIDFWPYVRRTLEVLLTQMEDAHA